MKRQISDFYQHAVCQELYLCGCPDLTLPTGAELMTLQSSPATQFFLWVFTNGLLSEPLSIPLQLLCCLLKWSPFLWHTSGWNTCDQTAAGELNTCIFHKSPPASHHHPNKVLSLSTNNKFMTSFFLKLLIPSRQRIKRGKTKTRAMWLIKGTNLYLLACEGSCWYTPVKAKSNANISCHLTEPKTSGNSIWEVNRRTNYYKWS